MAARAKYKVEVRWSHRKFGPQNERLTAEGTSIRRAISNALLSFFSDKGENKQRRDAHKWVAVFAERQRERKADK